MTRTTTDELARYLDEVERWTAGGRDQRREIRAELEAHLREAEADDRLEEAMRSLGSPREAARTFGAGHRADPAPRSRRLAAAVVDYGTLFALTIGGAVAATIIEVTRGPSPDASFTFGLPGILEVMDSECAGCSPVAQVAFFGGLVGGLFWFAVALTVLEWRWGRTPGKALLGLRVVSEDGAAPDLGQVVLRRLPLVFSGPLQIADWAFALVGPTYQRAFDRVARTIVLRDRTANR